MWGGNQQLVNLIRREVHRAISMQAQARTRFALISAYDPDNHLIKAQIQPEGHETAWFPVGTDHIGNGFGVLHGPKIGDQIEVSFQEGDSSSPRMVRRVFSEKEKPPRVESGEILVRHESGSFVFIDKDGKVSIEGSADITIKSSGNVHINPA